MSTADDIRTHARALLAIADALDGGKSASGSVASVAGATASDADLDGQYGDPIVKFPSKRWEGEDFSEQRFSACSAEFLLSHASFLDWKADRDEASGDEAKLRKANYMRRDAVRARGWARRNESGPRGHRDAPPLRGDDPFPTPHGGGDDDIPF